MSSDEMIDVGQVLDLIDHLVETHGEDHVAPRCYVLDRQPECGVAKILHLLGVPVEKLISFGSTHLSAIPDERLGLRLTMGARLALEAFQTKQDARYQPGGSPDEGTWGSARTEAYGAVERYVGFLPTRLFESVQEKELALV